MFRLSLILFLLTKIAFGQNDLISLSIDQAVEYGIENNRNLINAEREILMAYNEKWKTIATGLPQVTANLDYSNYIELPTSLIPLEKFGGPPGEFSEVQFGLEQTAFGSMRMEQQIFDGSWIVGLQATKVYLETSKNFYEKTLLEVKEGVIKLYSLVSILKEGVILLKNNVENAFEIKNKSFVWKNHYVNTKFNDPDEGLIIQDQPWVDFRIKGYSDDP